MKRNYTKLSIEDFGRQLIISGDLDPVYIALRRVGWAPAQMKRWLVAYWCFYHCGLASYASAHEGLTFWRILRQAAYNDTPAPTGGRWPRGQERRHARGQQGIKMIADLHDRYGNEPENFVNNVACYTGGEYQIGPIPFLKIAERAQRHTLFGPWIAFKIADMLDAVFDDRMVNFEHAHIFMFKDPVKAALMLWRQHCKIDSIAQPKDQEAVIREVVEYLINTFGDLNAPIYNNRSIGLQEVETVLCKWKSHMNGHYPLFNDIDEILEGLAGWGEVADQFALAMPRRSEA